LVRRDRSIGNWQLEIRNLLMTPERWLQIKELFHESLACEPAQREEFLVAKCAGDVSLRTEVESLLSSLEEDDSFIEAPVGDLAAELLGTHRPTYEPGHQIQNYRILSRLGSGGMGEVYLAEDTKLNRKVALKLLPPHFTVNPDRVRRFEREARAASALNHPNIVTIYEIGLSDSTHFIATEFVDGKTLRQLINEKPLTLNETLNVSLQIAEALNGAHTAGIVHRDIKPENIMIRSDGYVKILDFGLAKLTEPRLVGVDAELETPTLLQTNPGLVMGTVQYMSPEQARAKSVGVGTDIWSLGIVMYELLTGHVPFNGETSSHVMVSLMEDKLPPLKNHANVPAELDQFVTKALRKNQRDRYQTAGDLARDLKNFKHQLQHDSRLKEWLKTVPSQKEGVPLPSLVPLTTISGTHLVALENRTATETSPLQSHVTATAEYIIREVKSHRTLALATSVIIIFSAIGLTYFFKQRASSSMASQSASTVSALANPTQGRGTNNEEAYGYYLQGRKQINRGEGGNQKAIVEFLQAIRLDPNYAQAYAGLAYAYFGFGTTSGGSPRIENEKAKQAVKKALELDSSLAEAYAVRGLLDLYDEWDHVAAEKDLTTALALDPNNATAHWVRALLYNDTGRFELALKEIETAQEIVPIGLYVGLYDRERGKIFYYARRYDEAIVQLKRHVELQPDAGQVWLSRAYEMKGDYAAAFEVFITTQKDPQRVEAFRTTFETAGWQGVMRKFTEFSLLDEQNGKAAGSRNYKIAIAFAQLGEKDQAFKYLNKLVAERSWQISQLNVDPQVDPLRGDPRFEALIKLVRR
jgi:serine/threonine protein kinase/lipoprotein NlpI